MIHLIALRLKTFIQQFDNPLSFLKLTVKILASRTVNAFIFSVYVASKVRENWHSVIIMCIYQSAISPNYWVFVGLVIHLLSPRWFNQIDIQITYWWVSTATLNQRLWIFLSTILPKLIAVDTVNSLLKTWFSCKLNKPQITTRIYLNPNLSEVFFSRPISCAWIPPTLA